jgi:methionyl-tRNA formyltransferase
MQLTDVGMVAGETYRSQYYLQYMLWHEIIPAQILILRSVEGVPLPGQTDRCKLDSAGKFKNSNFIFDVDQTLYDTIKDHGIPFTSVNNADINSDVVIAAVCEMTQPILIYSGYGGGILRESILNSGKRFLHAHGGYLPDYKGSTTNYYSIINENICGASTIFLSEEIDYGPILHRKKVPAPSDKTRVDYEFDSRLRAEVMVETLQMYHQNGTWPDAGINNRCGHTYYVIHPLLKHIAILGKPLS